VRNFGNSKDLWEGMAKIWEAKKQGSYEGSAGRRGSREKKEKE